MKRLVLIGAVISVTLLLAACAPAASTESPAQPQAYPGQTQTGNIPVTGEGTVMVSESTDHGSILVNSEGMSLYLFMADTQNSGMSTCNDDDGCSTEWPALTSPAAPVAGEGLDANLLGTLTRDDGTMQVTYNGWPLYLFHEDSAPGDVNGQGLEEFGGLWYLVSPAGEAVQQ